MNNIQSISTSLFSFKWLHCCRFCGSVLQFTRSFYRNILNSRRLGKASWKQSRIVIHVSAEVAQLFETASEEQRRKLGALVSLFILNFCRSGKETTESTLS